MAHFQKLPVNVAPKSHVENPTLQHGRTKRDDLSVDCSQQELVLS